MANASSGTVHYVDTTATTLNNGGKVYIQSVKYIGAATGTAGITSDGKTIWEEAGTANVHNECEMVVDNVVVNVTNGAKVYVYTARR